MSYKDLKWSDKFGYFFRWESTKHWLLTVIAVLSIWVLVEAGLTARAVRQQAQDKSYGQDIKDTLHATQEAVAEIKPAVQGLTEVESSAVGAVNDARVQIRTNGMAITNQIDGLGELRHELTATIAEGHHQLQQNGDEIHTTLVATTGLINNMDKNSARLMDSGRIMIDTTNGKLVEFFNSTNAILKGDDGLQGLVKKGNVVMLEAGGTMAEAHGTMGNINRATKDLADATHTLTHPVPCKTFGCHVVAILKAVKEGGGIAFMIEKLVQGLP